MKINIEKFFQYQLIVYLIFIFINIHFVFNLSYSIPTILCITSPLIPVGFFNAVHFYKILFYKTGIRTIYKIIILYFTFIFTLILFVPLSLFIFLHEFYCICIGKIYYEF